MSTAVKRLLIVAVLGGAMLAPVGASAYEPCNTDVIVYSYGTGAGGFQFHGAMCQFTEQEMRDLSFDPRLILPGTHSISVRYTNDIGPDTPSITATLNGLGFTNREITLNRVDTTGLSTFAYQSAVIPLQDGRFASGCVTIDVPAVLKTTQYHTADSACLE